MFERKDDWSPMRVYFVGAGPGDPELITLKGHRLLREADLVIYTGSLINRDLLRGLRAELVDSSNLSLEEITERIIRSVREGKKVVRLHSGDPSLYGAILEQMRPLEESGIDVEV
ncbi:SAM-dependent methyltransferase, partial [Methanothrix sp.]|uniref:SAM-dependent methyltransferase n=1 Tax=Methanothrix sp. TaxID=90426 RepID=UPI003983154D